MSIIDYIRYILFCWKNEKIKLKLDLKSKMDETLFHFTDLITMIKSLQEIEILKKILLKGKQKRIFHSTLINSFNDRIGSLIIYNLLNSEKNEQNKNGFNLSLGKE